MMTEFDFYFISFSFLNLKKKKITKKQKKNHKINGDKNKPIKKGM